MKASVGLFYASSTGNTATVARRIAKCLEPIKVDVYDIMHFKRSGIPGYNKLIFGIPTWDSTDIHEDWKQFLPVLSKTRRPGKKVALFGCGDQKTYSLSFADNMGLLYDWLLARKSIIVGRWPVNGYQFRKSDAIRENHFVGLVLDEDTQPECTGERIRRWTDQLKNEFYAR